MGIGFQFEIYVKYKMCSFTQPDFFCQETEFVTSHRMMKGGGAAVETRRSLLPFWQNDAMLILNK